MIKEYYPLGMISRTLTLLCVQISYLNPSKIPTVKIDENANISNIGVICLQMNIEKRPIVCPDISYTSSKNLVKKTKCV